LLVSEMKTRMADQHKMLMGGLKGEALANYLGDEVVNELLAYKVAEIKGKNKVEPLVPPEETPKVSEESGKPDRSTKYLRSLKEFMADE
jgi:hypothetical protein